METGICKLCGQEGELHLSHVIPKFVFRWFKRTSATGFMRSGSAPNRREQDGRKRYWLCTSCEALLNEAETTFATKVFHPLMTGEVECVEYGPWMLKFAVSLSWRAALDHLEGPDSSERSITAQQASDLRMAMERWGSFLLGTTRDPGNYEQHLLRMGAIHGPTTLNLPKNINRFLLRTIDMTIAYEDQDCATYVKFGPWIFFGFVSMRKPKEWQGTRIRFMKGTVGPRKISLPIYIWPFLVARANNQACINARISLTQREIIREAYRQRFPSAALSETEEAIRHDRERFGDSALIIHPSNDT